MRPSADPIPSILAAAVVRNSCRNVQCSHYERWPHSINLGRNHRQERYHAPPLSIHTPYFDRQRQLVLAYNYYTCCCPSPCWKPRVLLLICFRSDRMTIEQGTSCPLASRALRMTESRHVLSSLDGSNVRFSGWRRRLSCE
jgi:hypothetical protein